DELTETRRDIHAHPELGFTEERTGDLVAKKLAEYGCEVHRGLAKTGVVGTIRRGNSLRAIGLRADMDCLPMQEMNQFPRRSPPPTASTSGSRRRAATRRIRITGSTRS